MLAAIDMRAQKAIDLKTGITTHRKLTLDDLYMQLKHYRPQTRKGDCYPCLSLVALIAPIADAFMGLKELLSTYPALAVLQLRNLLEKTLPVAIDEDRDVRRAFAGFMNALLPLCNRVSADRVARRATRITGSGISHRLTAMLSSEKIVPGGSTGAECPAYL